MQSYCSDVDGVLCVVVCTPDYNEPKIIHNQYQTRIATRDALSYFQVGDVADLFCKETFPGEYYLGTKYDSGLWKAGQHVALLDGRHTLPVGGFSVEVEPPKTRKGTQTWWNGHLGTWMKRTSRGVQQC